ncbi:MAG: hypothetical protein EXR02_00200 [Rhodospirillales bacterium]|nr:hypothetical protein [Rhodospirillales bacterium]MSP79479.1 hypothetical protein [Rhodospirillales bacterium]
MDQLIAWAVLIFGIVLPATHVVFAPGAQAPKTKDPAELSAPGLMSGRPAPPGGGGWKAVPGARCPFGPRLGWLIVVTFLPFAGWLMFIAARRRRRRL